MPHIQWPQSNYYMNFVFVLNFLKLKAYSLFVSLGGCVEIPHKRPNKEIFHN